MRRLLKAAFSQTCADELYGELSLFDVTFVTSFQLSILFLMDGRSSVGITFMDNVAFCLIAQLNLMFGVAGLIWPDELMPVFRVFMFPWPASYRALRVNGVIAIGAYLVVLGKLLIVGS